MKTHSKAIGYILWIFGFMGAHRFYFGLHRFYLGKWISGIVYLLTGGIFLLGLIYDFWTLDAQISEANHALRR